MTEAEYLQYLVRVKATRSGGDDGPCATTPLWEQTMRLAGERLAAANVEAELVKMATDATCDQATYDAYCRKIELDQAIKCLTRHHPARAMQSDAPGIEAYRLLPPPPMQPHASGVKPAPHGICTTADGDHRLGRFKA